MTEQAEQSVSHAVTLLSSQPHHNLNDWFLSQEAGRQQILNQDKWMLAEAAFQAGRASMQSGLPMAILDSSTDNGVTLTTEGTKRLQELDFVPLFLSAPVTPKVGVPHGWSITEENGRLVVQNLAKGADTPLPWKVTAWPAPCCTGFPKRSSTPKPPFSRAPLATRP